MEDNNCNSRVILEEYGIPNVSDFSSLQNSVGWSIKNFNQKLQLEVIKISTDKRDLELDLIGCSTALANAFRRILLSEVPSMAIEKVYIYNNTSLLQDEVLAHRLGLIPLKADSRLFEFLPEFPTVEQAEHKYNAQDTLKYSIKVTCTRNPNASKDSRRPDDIYFNNNVYSKHIKWEPIGQQDKVYPHGDEQLGVLERDILICKMRPGQEIHADLYAVKGIGKDHAKFSPVATATYRLMPDIQIIKPIRGEMAERFKSCFSPGVIDVVATKGVPEARVRNARYDSCSRNVFSHEDLKECVQLGRVPDHFIFTIESVGALPSTVLFVEAVKVLKNKCKAFLEELYNIS